MEKPLPKPDNLSKPRIAPKLESTLVCVTLLFQKIDIALKNQ